MHLLRGAMPVRFTLKNSTPSTDEQKNLYYLITPCQRRQNLRNQTFCHCGDNLCTTQLCLRLKSIWVGRLIMYATILTERQLDMSQKNYVLLRTRIDLCEMIFAFSESSVLNSLGLNSFINESIPAYNTVFL